MTRSRRIPTALSLAVTVILALGAGASPALAGEAHPVIEHTGFETDTFSNPNGIAVEESTGDVYVADIGTDTVYKFDANGNPVNFAALGSNALTGTATKRPNRSRSHRCTAAPRRSRSITLAYSTPRRSPARSVKNSTPRPATCT